MNNKTHVWITKYALTQGIFERDIEHPIDSLTSMVSCNGKIYLECYHREGREWHLTYTDAVKRANEMRYNKIRALTRQISKLKSLRF